MLDGKKRHGNAFFAMRLIHEAALFRACGAFLLLFVCMACRGPGYYVRDRAMDFADIVTAGAEKSVYGVNVTAGPLTLGVNESSNGLGVGLRAGTVGQYSTGSPGGSFTEPDGRSFVLLNSVSHRPASHCRGGSRAKAFRYRNALLVNMYDISGYNSFFQFEIAFGLYGGLRVGLNLAEALDFVIGITGLDLLSDDKWCDDETD